MSALPALDRLSREASHTVTRRTARGHGALPCWLSLPQVADSGAEPLIAVHGILRRADHQATLLGARAADAGRAVIAPQFDRRGWPQYQQVVRGGRADLALFGLLADLRLSAITSSKRFALAGYSAGAQFAHRLAMLYPHLVSHLVVIAAGWYTFPDAAPFPYGMAPRPGRRDDWGPAMAAGLDRFLRIPITVCVGEHDTQSDEYLRRGAALDEQQGTDRVTRALRWVEALRRTAGAHGIEAQIELVRVPGCGHDFRACVRDGGLDRTVIDRAFRPRG